MIGIDTNVIVRHLVQDDPQQSAAANALLETLTPQEPGFISFTTVVETHWVLRRSYRTSATETAAAIRLLLETRELQIEQPDLVRAALLCVDDGIDFADALIAEAGRSAGCDYSVTLDQRAGRHPHMRLLAP